MREFKKPFGPSVAAAILAAAARKAGSPGPGVACTGWCAAGVCSSCSLVHTVFLPSLALALFVAPVLARRGVRRIAQGPQGQLGARDQAWSSSRSDSRPPPSPSSPARSYPAMPWAAAIALGAVVAPPDAVAATAVLRQLRPPHRILTILEGESLLNDASALLIYRLAVGAVSGERLLPRAQLPRPSCSRSPAASSSARRSGGSRCG